MVDINEVKNETSQLYAVGSVVHMPDFELKFRVPWRLIMEEALEASFQPDIRLQDQIRSKSDLARLREARVFTDFRTALVSSAPKKRTKNSGFPPVNLCYEEVSPCILQWNAVDGGPVTCVGFRALLRRISRTTGLNSNSHEL